MFVYCVYVSAGLTYNLGFIMVTLNCTSQHPPGWPKVIFAQKFKMIRHPPKNFEEVRFPISNLVTPST